MFNENKAVAALAEIVALEYGVHPTVASQIRTAAALRNIGNQQIHQSIINKPCGLTESEFAIVKNHTLLGAEILSDIQGNLGEMARLIALYHHEHWDSKGYWGKHTCELPVYVSIVSVADTYSALICDRPYKNKAWTPEDALYYIKEESGARFAPALAKVFISVVRGDGRAATLFDGRR